MKMDLNPTFCQFFCQKCEFKISEFKTHFKPLNFQLNFTTKYGKMIELNFYASVAQLDRASDFGSEGRGFESYRVRHYNDID